MTAFSDDECLFAEEHRPLWARLRPDSFSAFVDFSGLLEIRERFIKKPFSLLLYGQPGIGKTTFLELLAQESRLPVHQLPATSVSLEEIRALLKKATGTIIIFLDEIHRFSKARQDFFLKPLEEGEIILLAATTESPWYYLTRPLLSRITVKEIHPPPLEKFKEIIKNSWQQANLPPWPDIILQAICERVWPDFRKVYQTLEYLQPFLLTNRSEKEIAARLEEYFRENRHALKNAVSEEYDLLSAFIKSVRGSAVNAALLYLAQMLHIGVDVTTIARRLVILAAEDIGLANSQALVLAQAGLAAIERIGMPEARIILSEVTIYLAASPKSNSAYNAINKALDYVEKHPVTAPGHICNNSPDIRDYKYPHDYRGFVRQNYWPLNSKEENFYDPYLPDETIFPNSMEPRIMEQLRRLKEDESK